LHHAGGRFSRLPHGYGDRQLGSDELWEKGAERFKKVQRGFRRFRRFRRFKVQKRSR
jgi:hypothetical protein